MTGPLPPDRPPPPPGTTSPEIERFFKVMGRPAHRPAAGADATGAAAPSSLGDVGPRAAAYLKKLSPSIQGEGGSAHLMAAARALVGGFALPIDDAVRLLLDAFNPRCVPEWSEAEIRHKCDDAAKSGRKDRGYLLKDDAAPRNGKKELHPGNVALALAGFDFAAAAEHPPATLADAPRNSPSDRPPPPKPGRGPEPTFPPGTEDHDPSRLATLFLYDRTTDDGCRLCRKDGGWFDWFRGAYRELSDDVFRADLSGFIDLEFERIHQLRLAAFRADREKGGDGESKPPKRHRTTRAVVLDAQQMVAARVTASADQEPFWIGDAERPAANTVPFSNGLLALPADGGPLPPLLPPTPAFFCRNRLGFAYDPDPPPPAHWPAFLESLWPDDSASIDLLQEWFGYLLSLRTDLQKMLLIVGPARAGKGTINRVLTRLIGPQNVCTPTLSDLAERFGLQELLGKAVAMIGDARLSGRDDTVAVTERLLSISGEDRQSIDRKFKEAVSVQLGVRFVLFSNEVPKLGDSSAAIVTRMSVLKLTKSFFGREVRDLDKRFTPELPGIFHWAMDGLRRLLKNDGQFTRPDSARSILDDVEAMASPITTFVQDRCELGAEHFTTTNDLFGGWKKWSETGNRHVGDVGVFTRNLKAAFPAIEQARPRGGDRRRGYGGIRLLSGYEAGDLD